MEMEDEEMPCTTLSVKSVVVDEGATCATAAGAPTRTTTTAIQHQQEGETIAGANEEVRQAYAMEDEQIRAVFSNGLVSKLKLNFTHNIKIQNVIVKFMHVTFLMFFFNLCRLDCS